jgi:hypothetical protein
VKGQVLIKPTGKTLIFPTDGLEPNDPHNPDNVKGSDPNKIVGGFRVDTVRDLKIAIDGLDPVTQQPNPATGKFGLYDKNPDGTFKYKDDGITSDDTKLIVMEDMTGNIRWNDVDYDDAFWVVALEAVVIDLDIDSDNSGYVDGSPAEDALELVSTTGVNVPVSTASMAGLTPLVLGMSDNLRHAATTAEVSFTFSTTAPTAFRLLMPVVGEAFDGLNGLISLGRGDLTAAWLSFAGMIPVGGQAATAGKLTLKYGDEVAAAAGRCAAPVRTGVESLANLRKLRDSRLKGLGVNAEELKKSIVGNSGRTFNVAVGDNGAIFLIPVKKGAGPPIPTRYNLDELPNLFPRGRRQ